ncbi:MAG: hypothetical protein R2818_12130 [Flavobacteriales bacterium]
MTEYFGARLNSVWSTLDLVPLPTVTSARFEIAIARNARPDGTNALFSSNTIRLLFVESDGGDAMPNVGSTFSYTFDATPVPPAPVITLQKGAASDVRVLSWNVLSDGITNSGLQDRFQRVLTATAPDIIGLSECVTSTAAQVKTRLDAWLPIGGAGWQVVKDDFDLIIAARWPITQTWPALSRQFPALIDLPSTYRTDLLFTASHLNCCTADATRQDQVDAYVQFVQDARTTGGVIDLPEGTPMIYAGDMNLVGYAQQLNTLLTGDIQNNASYGLDGPMDWDGGANTDLVCRQTEGRMAYTWRNNNSAYPCGRLDLVLYTDAVASVAKSFALRTGIMSSGALASSGLLSNDVESASDHYPIIADMVLPQASITLQARVFLEGPFDQNTGIMHDSLRVKSLVPANEPYSALGFAQVGNGGGETIEPGVLAISGADAIVDWVMIELRDATDPAVIRATRCALLQRDGDVVDMDGTSALPFAMDPGNYFVAARHRNHLGVMTAAPLLLGPISNNVDFAATMTPSFGTEALKAVGGIRAMWAGNTVRDGMLRYTGQANDRDLVLSRIGGVVPTNVVGGYFVEDLNMDGRVLYTGNANDRDLILTNIGGAVATTERLEQLP